LVDERLRFFGIAGLHVADASVRPTIISGNTNTPTAMIAEKGAAMVLKDARWLKRKCRPLAGTATHHAAQHRLLALTRFLDANRYPLSC
jgi:choline dehydrogenase-like flavoprotein